MSDKNLGIVLALAAGVYMLSKQQARTGYVATPRGTVAVMPGSAGAGWQQTATSALTGFLQGAASGVLNGANAYTPSLTNSYQSSTDLMQSGVVQDVADPVTDWADYV